MAKSKKENQSEKWHYVNADGVVLGRLATRVATILMGKHTPHYVDYHDTGDHVIVLNAGKFKLTGKKADQKTYKRYSGYPGGLNEQSMAKKMDTDPTIPMRKAIEGMLPKTNLGHKMAKKLFIYANETHPHGAQKPAELTI